MNLIKRGNQHGNENTEIRKRLSLIIYRYLPTQILSTMIVYLRINFFLHKYRTRYKKGKKKNLNIYRPLFDFHISTIFVSTAGGGGKHININNGQNINLL